jgi:hypothetical protein
MRRLVMFFFIILTLATSSNFAQTIGQIFGKSEANTLFGSVLESVTMSQSQLSSILSQTQNYVMFKVSNGTVTILGDNRAVLYSSGTTVSSTEVFNIASKSKVIELLNLGTGSQIFIERRSQTLTITKDMNTLEEMQPCPPYCYN